MFFKSESMLYGSLRSTSRLLTIICYTGTLKLMFITMITGRSVQIVIVLEFSVS